MASSSGRQDSRTTEKATRKKATRAEGVRKVAVRKQATPRARATPPAAPTQQLHDEISTIQQQLHVKLDDVFARYAKTLVRHGHDLDDIGGIEQVADTIEQALPRPNRFARRVGPIYTSGQLRRLLPGLHTDPVTDQAVRNRREAGRLVAFKTADDRWAFPAFQFTVRPGRLEPRADVIELWQLLPLDSPLPTVDQAAWLTGPRRDLDGQTPLQWLDTHGLDEQLRRAAGQLRRRAAA